MGKSNRHAIQKCAFTNRVVTRARACNRTFGHMHKHKGDNILIDFFFYMNFVLSLREHLYSIIEENVVVDF